MSSKTNIIIEGPFYSSDDLGIRARNIYRSFSKHAGKDVNIMLMSTYDDGKTWVSKFNDLDREIDENIKATFKFISEGENIKISKHIYIGLDPSSLKPKSENVVFVTNGTIATQPSQRWKILHSKFVDSVVVPTKFVKDSIDLFGKDKTKVKVVEYSVNSLDQRGAVAKDDLFDTDFNFICSDDMTVESNLSQLVRSFYKAFYNNDRVGLILNTKMLFSSRVDRESVLGRLKQLVRQLDGAKCKLYLAHGDLDMNNDAFNAYVTTSRGMNYDSKMCSFMKTGKPIVVSSFEPFKEIAGKSGIFYNYALEDVTIQDINLYDNFSKWASYEDSDISKAMLNAVSNYDKHLKSAKNNADKAVKYSEDDYMEKLYKSIMEGNDEK